MATVLVAMADKKMTIRCEETDESFEVTVPDGLRIYEYALELFSRVSTLFQSTSSFLMKVRFKPRVITS